MLYYEYRPGDQTVLLIPGVSGNITALYDVANHLEKSGFGTLAVDLPGHGKSPHDDSSYTLDACVEQIEEITSAEKIGRPHVMGQSLGGIVALEYALRGNARSVTLMQTPYTVASHLVRMHGWLQSAGYLISTVVHALRLPNASRRDVDYNTASRHMFLRWLSEVFQNEPRHFSAVKRLTMALSNPRFDESVHQLDIPAMLIFTKEDDHLPEESAYRMRVLMPDSQIVILNGVHGPAFSTNHSKEIADTLLGFYGRI